MSTLRRTAIVAATACFALAGSAVPATASPSPACDHRPAGRVRATPTSR
ncbi:MULTISPECIES: hypothetical protein [Mumia]|uniref:Uncharacterized protein n=1 Tax=Mumia xiangluensis TaxID=1678900 RepID=A0ABW1QQG8_9ACTN|nr:MULTISPECIES: hypothetical protein [Mumia]